MRIFRTEPGGEGAGDKPSAHAHLAPHLLNLCTVAPEE